jgi:hypothetical protein
MRLLFFSVVLLFLLAYCSKGVELPQIDTASKYIGIKEIGNNAGFSDKIFEAQMYKTGWRKGQAWCSWFVSFILNKIKAIFPKIRTGLARNFIMNKSIEAHQAQYYRNKLNGWLAIWQHGNTIHGHIGIVSDWQRESGRIIQGNVTGGIKERKEKINYASAFRITHFTPVTTKDNPLPPF